MRVEKKQRKEQEKLNKNLCKLWIRIFSNLVIKNYLNFNLLYLYLNFGTKPGGTTKGAVKFWQRKKLIIKYLHALTTTKTSKLRDNFLFRQLEGHKHCDNFLIGRELELPKGEGNSGLTKTPWQEFTGTNRYSTICDAG